MLEIVYKKVNDLIPYVNNARIHSDAQINQIASSVKEFQFTNPILTDGDNGIIAGHGRLIAAKKLGMDSVPTVELSHLSPAQKKAYIIADNKLALEASWDEELLALEFADLEAMDFDLELTGFTLDEIEAFDFDGDNETEGLTDPDEVPELQDEPVSKLGDTWLLGKHRVMCGDSTKIDDVERLMSGKKARLVITDPPYGVSYSDKNIFLNSIDEGNRNQINIENDHLSKEETQKMWKDSFSNMALSMDKRAVVYCFMPQGGDQMMMMMMMMEGAGIEPRHELIWVKNNHVLGRSDYCYKHEPILYAWMKGGHKFYGEFSTSLIECNKPTSSKLHPTMKPIELLEKLVNNSSLKGELLFDLFLGSGSTIIASEKTNRICYGLEISPHYTDVICQRWSNFTGLQPTLESTGQTFNEVKEALNG